MHQAVHTNYRRVEVVLRPAPKIASDPPAGPPAIERLRFQISTQPNRPGKTTTSPWAFPVLPLLQISKRRFGKKQRNTIRTATRMQTHLRVFAQYQRPTKYFLMTPNARPTTTTAASTCWTARPKRRARLGTPTLTHSFSLRAELFSLPAPLPPT